LYFKTTPAQSRKTLVASISNHPKIKTMKKTFSIIILFTISILTYGQSDIDKLTKPIVEEGKSLYRSEMASWYGTDLFLEKFTEREKIGGYVSYTENDISKCVFLSKSDTPKVIGTISFDSTYNLKTATTNLLERELTKTESDLFEIRQIALNIVQKDTLFKTYKNTNLNFIPLISNGNKKVYILTGPTQNGVVIFGNDYLLTFDNENKLVTKKQLHKNIIPINYGGKEEQGKEVEGAIHSHLPETGDFMTATDICTLMLYEKFAKWKQHTVVSENYISIWNCRTDELVAITREVMEKINKDQEKRSKKDKKNKD
jgi:hypothetical protein